jgi:acetyl esterase/lipase
MGDSAGGGLSLAITEKLKADGIRMADELILISPWVDVAMDNPTIEAFTEVDPWLWPDSVRVCGRMWAGEAGTGDWHVSPIYGDLSGIVHVTVFTGTKEVILPDTLRLFEKLDRNADNKLIVGDGMMHVYPLMPIPEAHQAQQEIFERVMR